MLRYAHISRCAVASRLYGTMQSPSLASVGKLSPNSAAKTFFFHLQCLAISALTRHQSPVILFRLSATVSVAASYRRALSFGPFQIHLNSNAVYSGSYRYASEFARPRHQKRRVLRTLPFFFMIRVRLIVVLADSCAQNKLDSENR